MKHLRFLLPGAFALALACALGATNTTRVGTSVSPETVTLPGLDYPLALLHRGITRGEVQVLLKIGPDARLIDSLVTSYTRKELADYTLGALGRGKFRPLLVDGQPVTTIVELVLRFESKGLIAIERHGVDRDNLRSGQFAYEPCDSSRLDRPLQPITVVRPDYPRELGQQGIVGGVLLEYYIDEAGHVRMPRINESENQILARLSLAAVEQWQFNPPLSRNKPVLVRVRQRFEFAPSGKG